MIHSKKSRDFSIPGPQTPNSPKNEEFRKQFNVIMIANVLRENPQTSVASMFRHVISRLESSQRERPLSTKKKGKNKPVSRQMNEYNKKKQKKLIGNI